MLSVISGENPQKQEAKSGRLPVMEANEEQHITGGAKNNSSKNSTVTTYWVLAICPVLYCLFYVISFNSKLNARSL